MDSVAKPSAEEARAALQAERQERLARCHEVIREALATYRCTVIAQPYIDADGRVRARVTLQAQD